MHSRFAIRPIARHAALCLLLLIARPAVAQLPSIPYPGGVDADLWVLAGQSNMAGNALPRAEDIAPDPRIMLFNMDNTWIEAREPLTRIFDSVAPVHREILAKAGNMSAETFQQRQATSKLKPIGKIGPGLFFARHLLTGVDRPIGLIACAHGGTSIRGWDPALKRQGGHSLYGAMLERIQMVGGKVKGVLWYQGESEAMSPTQSELYETSLLNLIDHLRADVGDPNLPFIYVQIAGWSKQNDSRAASWERVRELQRRVAPQRQNVYMISAIDLDTDDEIHLGFEGQQRLGKRLAEVALSEVYGLPNHAHPIDLESVEVQNPTSSRPTIHVRFRGVTGKLVAPGRPTGFALRFPGVSDVVSQIYRVDFDPEDPQALILRFGMPLPNPAELIYAPGIQPYVNITDDRDMAIPAFGPLPLKWDDAQTTPTTR